MREWIMPRVGDEIKIVDNGGILTHNTPRWSYGEKARVIRLNDKTITVVLLTYYPGERIRIDYEDCQVVQNPDP